MRKKNWDASQTCIGTWEDSINVIYLKKRSPSKEGGMKELNSKFLQVRLTKKRSIQNKLSHLDNIYSPGNYNKR